MRYRVTSYDMSAPPEVSYFVLAKKAGSADPASGDKEVGAPPVGFEHAGDWMMETRSTVIESEQNRRAGGKFVDGADRRRSTGDGIYVPLKILAPKFVDVRAFAREAA